MFFDKHSEHKINLHKNCFEYLKIYNNLVIIRFLHLVRGHSQIISQVSSFPASGMILLADDIFLVLSYYYIYLHTYKIKNVISKEESRK